MIPGSAYKQRISGKPGALTLRMIEQAGQRSLLKDLSVIEEIETIPKRCLGKISRLLLHLFTISGLAGSFSLCR
jgi:hypothetical protein